MCERERERERISRQLMFSSDAEYAEVKRNGKRQIMMEKMLDRRIVSTLRT